MRPADLIDKLLQYEEPEKAVALALLLDSKVPAELREELTFEKLLAKILENVWSKSAQLKLDFINKVDDWTNISRKDDFLALANASNKSISNIIDRRKSSRMTKENKR